jgi:hypothetical protein
MSRALPLLFLAACGPMQPLPTDDDGSNAIEAWADAAGQRRDVFAYGGSTRNDVVDVLFVLDHSVSMRHVVARVQEALVDLDAAAFPAETRIAFTSTLPARPDRLNSVHRAAKRRGRMQWDPGFAQLVSRDTIAAARANTPEIADHFAHDGCDAWFRPGDTNAAGVSCMVAHSQISQQGVGVEAGLTAVDQLMARRTGRPTFRPGASVNIVFISDTHDPGIGPNAAAELIDLRPTGHDLVQAILADNPVSAVRLHAIAPETECVEQWAHIGPSYFDAVEATGGVKLDVCTATDYRPLLTTILHEGAVPTQPVFGLVTAAEEVEQVLLDGEPVVFTPHPTLPTVTLELPPTVDPRAEHRVEIEYRARTVAPPAVAPVATPRGH